MQRLETAGRCHSLALGEKTRREYEAQRLVEGPGLNGGCSGREEKKKLGSRIQAASTLSVIFYFLGGKSDTRVEMLIELGGGHMSGYLYVSFYILLPVKKNSPSFQNDICA